VERKGKEPEKDEAEDGTRMRQKMRQGQARELL